MQNENGDWVIPSTRRPDGTWRKEIKVKAGYVPQEEVGVFQTVASRAAARASIPGLAPQSATTTNKTKKKSKKIEELDKQSCQVDNISSAMAPLSISSESHDPEPILLSTDEINMKKLRGLKKKLKDIIDLEKNIADGKINPNPEQIQKIERKKAILDEIDSLEKL